MYIVVKDGNVQELSTLKEVYELFKIEISLFGQITFEGVVDTISYNMNDYSTIEEVLNDFRRNRMSTLAYRKGIKIYKGEQL